MTPAWRFRAAGSLLLLSSISLHAQQSHLSPYERAQQLRGALEARPETQRTRAAYERVLEAYRADFEARTNEHAQGLYTVGSFPEGHGVNAHEIGPGVVYKDANVAVSAFPTKHALESYGYRFDTPDRSIVLSGDTNPTQATIDACHGCDVLIHEVQTLEWLAKRPDFQAYAARHHTTTAQLAELATKAKPRLLILYHASIALRPAVNPRASSPAALLDEMSSRYAGAVVVGRDLDVY